MKTAHNRRYERRARAIPLATSFNVNMDSGVRQNDAPRAAA